MDPTLDSTAATFPRQDDPKARCRACGAVGLLRFYTVNDIPVHSCLLVPSRAEAMAFPTGRLDLGCCPRCGFIGNLAFDPYRLDYGAAYEETQGFSPTFNAFARDLVGRLDARHRLRDKTVLEIGCGKGEFLALLCETAGCRGIGIDPACRPERLERSASERIEFIADVYDQRSANLEADLIVCRHTLEHIDSVQRFMEMLRRTIGDRPTVIFFEVPDVLRQLDEGAFWDLYYEHCSYFSPGSLARLFRRCGFRIDELELVYDDQYIVISATPDGKRGSARSPLEDDLDKLRLCVETFPERCGRIIERWRRFLGEAAADGDRTVLWGSGSKAVGFLSTLGITDAIDHVVDINPHKQGRFIAGTGQEIIAPAALTELRPDRVIVMNPIYLDEIGRDLNEMGLSPILVAV